MMKHVFMSLCAFLLVFAVSVAHAESMKKGGVLEVKVHMLTTDKADGLGKSIGSVFFIETEEGLIVEPDLKGLPAGEHGMHIHVNPALGPVEKDGKLVAGLKAGGHYDPKNTGKHLGPYANGHLGDLPVLFVDKDGTTPVDKLAPRIKKLSEIKGRSLMIHIHGDNYSDTPAPLGGGGGRLAGGIIK